jgi:hypothetical protein
VLDDELQPVDDVEQGWRCGEADFLIRNIAAVPPASTSA